MTSIYNNISDFIIILNFEGTIKFCNKSFLNKLQYKEEEIINKNIFKITKQRNYFDKINEDENIEFYSKNKEIIKIDARITIDNFKNEKNIFIVGKEINSKPYTMEMLEELLDTMDVGAFITDLNGKYIYVNDVSVKGLNKKKEEVIGTYIQEHWPQHTCDKFNNENIQLFKSAKPRIFSEKLNCGENEYFYRTYKAPIFKSDGTPKYITATCQNVTLKKFVTETLLSNYNKISSSNKGENNINYNENLNEVLKEICFNILDYTNADGLSLLLYNKDKNLLEPVVKLESANEIFENIDSISLNKINSNLLKNRKYSNCQLHREEIKAIIESEHICVEDSYQSGNYIIELYNEFIGVICLNYNENNSPLFNSDEYMEYICNKIAMVIKNIRLSNQVRIENKKRRYSEKELERYLEISVDMIAMFGKDGRTKLVSPNWIKLLGWSEEELLNMNIEDIVHPCDINKYRNTLKALDQQVIRKVIRFRHKNGYYSYLDWSSGYFADEEIYITTARDITEKLAEEQEKRILEETIKLQNERNEFFSNISHEFRTPINIILGTTQVIKKNMDTNKLDMENLSKYINYIKQNSYRLLRLVNNSIDISKMDAGAYELRCSNENIISIIEEITLSVADFTKNNNINLIFDTEVEELITYCDADKIERIILNLMSNAIKYTPEGGFIKVDISATQDNVIVSIKDSGIGIPKEKQNYIFNRFGQLDGSLNRLCEGSGIGLSLVKKLVEMHGGQIYVNSEVEQGSEFIFTIPIRVEEEINYIQYDSERKSKHVERCEIEFSDIYG